MWVPLCQAAALLPAGISWPPSASPQILDEVEKRRQISMAVIYPFMQGLRESPFPAPGKTVTIKSFIPESGTEVGLGDSAWGCLHGCGLGSEDFVPWGTEVLLPMGESSGEDEDGAHLWAVPLCSSISLEPEPSVQNLTWHHS